MFLAKQEAGERVPFLEDRPQDVPDNAWLFDAFCALASQRLTGHENVPQAIQLSEIAAYCHLMDITDSDEKEELTSVVVAMDAVALEYIHEQRHKDQKKQQREAKAKQSMSRRRRR